MPAVRPNILLILIIVGCVTTALLERGIKGFYVEKDSPVGISSTYHFNDGTFEIISYEHLNIQKKFGGSYQISGDTLILDFESLTDPDPSSYTFIDRKPASTPVNLDSSFQESNLGSVKFHVVNQNDKPLIRTILISRDNSKNKIKTYLPDSLGYFPKISLTVEKPHDFKFIHLGRKTLIMPADTVVGGHSKVKVTLSDSTTYYSDYNNIKKYLIK